MSGGSRGAIIAASGIALIAGLTGGAVLERLYSADQQQQQAVAHQQPGSGEYRGPADSLPDIAGLPGPVERIIANPRPEQGEDTVQRDLAAQEAMAVWAFWMVAVSLGTLLVAGLGTALIWRQVRLTRKAVEDTGQATVAMNKANEIALQAQRPWISIDLSVEKFHLSEHSLIIDYTVLFRNSGKLVAKQLATRVENFKQASLTAADIDAHYERLRQRSASSRFALMPGEDTFSKHYTSASVDHLPWRDDALHFLIIAVAYYTFDGDTEIHRTERAFLIGKPGDDIFDRRLIQKSMMGLDKNGVAATRARAGETT